LIFVSGNRIDATYTIATIAHRTQGVLQGGTCTRLALGFACF
jgi:hypothetical protein